MSLRLEEALGLAPVDLEPEPIWAVLEDGSVKWPGLRFGRTADFLNAPAWGWWAWLEIPGRQWVIPIAHHNGDKIMLRPGDELHVTGLPL